MQLSGEVGACLRCVGGVGAISLCAAVILAVIRAIAVADRFPHFLTCAQVATCSICIGHGRPALTSHRRCSLHSHSLTVNLDRSRSLTVRLTERHDSSHLCSLIASTERGCVGTTCCSCIMTSFRVSASEAGSRMHPVCWRVTRPTGRELTVILSAFVSLQASSTSARSMTSNTGSTGDRCSVTSDTTVESFRTFATPHGAASSFRHLCCMQQALANADCRVELLIEWLSIDRLRRSCSPSAGTMIMTLEW